MSSCDTTLTKISGDSLGTVKQNDPLELPQTEFFCDPPSLGMNPHERVADLGKVVLSSMSTLNFEGWLEVTLLEAGGRNVVPEGDLGRALQCPLHLCQIIWPPVPASLLNNCGLG